MKEEEITITFNLKTLRHLENYVKQLYHAPHVSNGTVEESACLYCLDFLTKIQKPLMSHVMRQKQRNTVDDFDEDD